MERWINKVAIVTGASAGIGAAIARDLVKAGMKVVGLARRVERVEAIAEELKNEKGKLYPIKCDVSKEEDITEAFRWVKDNLGGVEVLINNAGVLKLGLLTQEGNTEYLRSMLDTNVLGLVLCTREAVLLMKKQNVAGHIIHINSIGGHKIIDMLQNSNFFSIYPATKHAVTAITESLRQELIYLETRIKVTSISPGAVVTEIWGDQPLSNDQPVLQAEDVSQAVLYALGTPEHVQIHEIILKAVGERF